MSELVLVRHGETEWSRTRRHTGDTDLPLTEAGEAQARTVAPRLEGREFALVLSSPLQRARQTAELAGFGDRIELDDDLRERLYGEYEGLTTKEIRVERPGWDVWSDDLPGGETLEALGRPRRPRHRARAGGRGRHARVRPRAPAARRSARAGSASPPDGGGKLVLGTSSVSVLGFERERRVLKAWNLP